MEEIWKGIKGYEGIYEVSNIGRVRSVDRYHKGRYRNVLQRGKVILQGHDKNGYKIIQLSKDNKVKACKVHRLVYQAFLGELIEGMVIDHIDNNKQNNTVDNLQQITNRLNTTKDRTQFPCIYKNGDKYTVSVHGLGERYYIGTFSTIEEAQSARDRAIAEIEQGNKPTFQRQRNAYDSEGYKICSCCGERKQKTDYYKTYGKCKECVSKYNNQRRGGTGEGVTYRPRLTASVGKKICTCCGEEKPLTEFYLARTVGRYQTKCKECFKRQVYSKRNNNHNS